MSERRALARRGSRRFALLGAALMTSGCTGPETWLADGEVPASIAWLAALSVDAGGAVVASTGLLRRDGDATWAALDDPRAALVVVGWSEAALAPLIGALDEATLARERLLAGAAGEPALPAASWQASGVASGERVVLSASDPTPRALTASWLPPCPALVGARAEVDLRCPACRATVAQQGCRLTFEPVLCGVLALAATVDGQGELVFDDAQLLSRCALAATSTGASRSFLCAQAGGESCEVDLYEGEATPSFDVSVVEPLGPVPFIGNRGGKLTNQPVRGYLSGLVATPSGAVVGAFGSPTDWSCARDPLAPDKSSALHLFAPGAPVMRVRTATAPPCLTLMVPDPVPPSGSAGFLGVYGLGPQRLGRFDDEGQLRASVELPEVSGGAALVVAAAATPDGRYLGLVVMEPERDSAISSLVVVETASLAVRGAPTPLADRADSVVALGDGGFLAFETDDAGSVRVALDGTVSRVAERQSRCGLASDALSELGVARAAAVRVAPSLVLLSARARSPALLWVDAETDGCEPLAMSERALEPLATLALRDERWASYGGLDAIDGGYVGLIDIERRRLVRGATRIGQGTVSHLVEAPDGALWALITGAGVVARLERR